MDSKQKVTWRQIRAAGLEHRANSLRERLRLKLRDGGFTLKLAADQSWRMMCEVIVPLATATLAEDGIQLDADGYVVSRVAYSARTLPYRPRSSAVVSPPPQPVNG